MGDVRRREEVELKRGLCVCVCVFERVMMQEEKAAECEGEKEKATLF